jgi:hypothetical protein
MATSMIRHHTILNRPIIAFENEGRLINQSSVDQDTELFVARSRQLSVGRYLQSKAETEYRPVGYQISATKWLQERASGKLGQAIGDRLADHQVTAKARLDLDRMGSNQQ